jgi:hypothetical protein
MLKAGAGETDLAAGNLVELGFAQFDDEVHEVSPLRRRTLPAADLDDRFGPGGQPSSASLLFPKNQGASRSSGISVGTPMLHLHWPPGYRCTNQERPAALFQKMNCNLQSAICNLQMSVNAESAEFQLRILAAALKRESQWELKRRERGNLTAGAD